MQTCLWALNYNAASTVCQKMAYAPWEETERLEHPPCPETAKGRQLGHKEKRAKQARWKGQWPETKSFRFF
jgi:hypothetical protein